MARLIARLEGRDGDGAVHLEPRGLPWLGQEVRATRRWVGILGGRPDGIGGGGSSRTRTTPSWKRHKAKAMLARTRDQETKWGTRRDAVLPSEGAYSNPYALCVGSSLVHPLR